MTVRLYDWEENGYISKSDFTKIYFMLAKEEGFLPQNDRSGKKKKGEENPKQALLEDVEKIFKSVCFLVYFSFQERVKNSLFVEKEQTPSWLIYVSHPFYFFSFSFLFLFFFFSS